MGLTPNQKKVLELMRADNAGAGFPFAASQFWTAEAENFERVFEAAGVDHVESGYFNTRFSGITLNDPRLYEWFICSFHSFLRTRDRLNLLDRFEAIEEDPDNSPVSVTKNGARLEYGVPVNIGGRKVSADLLFSIHDFYNLLELNPGIATEALIVGDLGPGWGRLGHVLLQVNPRIRYVLFDIPESLLVSSMYLPHRLPGLNHSRYEETRDIGAYSRALLMSRPLWFLASQDLAKFPANGVDMMVNVASFQEMNADQVNRYLEIFDEVALGGHVYLRNNYLGAASRVDEYRFPEGWLRQFSRASAFSTWFYEAGWRVT